MPSYRYLFEEHQIGSEAQKSDRALKLTGTLEPKPGWEVVPTSRAIDLVGYLVNLKTAYDYPEAIPVVASGQGTEEGAKAPSPRAAPAKEAAPAGTGGKP
jgi:hypothetical protein